MDWAAYLTHIDTDGGLVAAAARSGLHASVPCCPGWTVRDVVEHTGIVHRHKTAIVRERLLENPEPPEAPAAELLPWFTSGLGELLDVLRSADPAERVYTWNPKHQTVGFWYRRMAHETLIHRVDAEQAHGSISPIDPELAADGVDEVLVDYVGGYPEWGNFRPGSDTARLSCTDRPDRWDVQFGRFVGTSPNTGTAHDLDAFIVTPDIEAPGVIINGRAADLDLWLWGRSPIDRLTVVGNAAVATLLRSICAEEMQ